MKSIILLGSLLLVAFRPVSSDGTWEQATQSEMMTAYQQSASWYAKSKSYRLNIRCASYRDHNTTKAHETQDGFFERDGDLYRSNVMGILTIQNDEMRVTIDSTNQIIIINDKSEITESPLGNDSFKRILDNAGKLKKRNTTGATHYRVEFNSNRLYDRYEFEIDKGGLFKSVKYYFSSSVKDDDASSGSKPRLELSFSDYTSGIILKSEKELSVKRYLQKQGSKFSLAANYKHFELKDMRLKSIHKDSKK